MKVATKASNAEAFKISLADYKHRIDTDIALYSQQLITDTSEQFGPYSAEAMEIFCDVLSRGGKRIRGALTMLTYEMFGGRDPIVATEAARIMELLQTYLLIADDVYDRSKIRRGRPSAHILHSELHTDRSWKDDSQHFGETLAFNSALVGSHTAMALAANLNVASDKLVRAIQLLNTNLVITGEGQSNDVYNEVTQTSSYDQINNVLIWKTAYYTFVNPLQFGAVLSNASEKDLGDLLDFSLHAGRTFQITDDILGTFGNEFDSGKSPMDDLREGKRTLLTHYALEHADKEDAYFLHSMLGNHDITQADFTRCKYVIEASGALANAKQEAKDSAEKAILLAKTNWQTEHPKEASFLIGLVEYLLERKS